MQATWDCRALRDALRSPAITSLVDVVAAVVSIASRPASLDDAEHFFQVELRKVVRLADDGLLSATLVTTYLSQVAPVPFHELFSSGEAIVDRLKRNGAHCQLSIHVNGSSERLTRPYRDRIAISTSKTTTLGEPTFFDVPDQDGALGAIGWITHHEYLGAFRRHIGVRGLRARVGNLQIGDEDCFETAFTEPRFNQWTIGEVHVLDPRVVPNGRRDFFEPNVHFEQLNNHVAQQAREVARRCRWLSSERRRERSVAELDLALSAYTKLLRHNRVARILRDELIDDVRVQLERTGRKVVTRADWESQASRIEGRLEAMAIVGKDEDGRATQRQMGQADVLRLLREHIPGGTAMSVQLLKLLEESS